MNLDIFYYKMINILSFDPYNPKEIDSPKSKRILRKQGLSVDEITIQKYYDIP